MNSESSAAVALLVYSGTLTIAIVLAILKVSSHTVAGVLAFGLFATIVWCVVPTLLRLLYAGRHGG